jgi:hypothetical protein
MRLYLLTRSCTRYDETAGVVVRAPNSNAARKIAADNCGGEGRTVWFLPSRTTCRVLTARGAEELILRDFNAG